MSDAAPINVFDAHCVFCAWSTRFILAHEAAPVIRFVAITSAEGRALAKQHGVNPDDPLTFLFIDAGKALTASDAVLAIAARLRWPWRAIGIARVIPRPLRDAAYGFVARHRYRLFGRSDACIAPDAATRARFTLPAAP
jgi:predicted DCC family thiol-disulfide oxidoreductase YuxK